MFRLLYADVNVNMASVWHDGSDVNVYMGRRPTDGRDGRQRVTLRDVARAADVSTATVTRVLQNSPRVVPETRQRVMEAVRRLGYSPNPMARDLRQGRPAGAVGLVTAGFTNMFQAGVAAGAERELRQAGLQLLIGSTEDDPAREPELAGAMIDRRVSALMMMPDGDERGFLSTEHTFGTPVVLVGRPANGLAADVVMTEDDRGVEEATSGLAGPRAPADRRAGRPRRLVPREAAPCRLSRRTGTPRVSTRPPSSSSPT